ncbi:hypothetical protein LJK88_20230 [Paenibacillus sp. P26]|nr:hypothetical protein LJK88_20230 [Paenibacillus sp. P26]
MKLLGTGFEAHGAESGGYRSRRDEQNGDSPRLSFASSAAKKPILSRFRPPSSEVRELLPILTTTVCCMPVHFFLPEIVRVEPGKHKKAPSSKDESLLTSAVPP